MKAIKQLLILAVLTSWCVASQAQIPQSSVFNAQEREVVVNVNDAFIPTGLVSTSEAFVVVSGFFPNSCYKWNRAEVTHTSALHEVRVIATVIEGMCLMSSIAVIVPYSHEVKLGLLAPGEHVIRFIGGDGTYLEKTFTVAN